MRSKSGKKGYAPANYLREKSAAPVMFKAVADYFGTGARLTIVKGEVLRLVKRTPGLDWIEVKNVRGEVGEHHLSGFDHFYHEFYAILFCNHHHLLLLFSFLLFLLSLSFRLMVIIAEAIVFFKKIIAIVLFYRSFCHEGNPWQYLPGGDFLWLSFLLYFILK